MALFGIFNHKTKESQNSKSEFEKDGLAESEKQSSATSESDLPDLNEAAEKADQEVTPDENERARDQLKKNLEKLQPKRASHQIQDELDNESNEDHEEDHKDSSNEQEKDSEDSSQEIDENKFSDQKNEEDEPAAKQEIESNEIDKEASKDKNERLTSKPSVPVTMPIIISFVNNESKIANDYRFTGKYGQKLTLDDLPKIPGYKPNIDKDFNYVISDLKQHITINYIPDVVSYQIVPVDEQMKPIGKNKNKTYKAKAGSEISLSKFPTVNGYTPFTARKYTVPKHDGEVKVVYDANMQNLQVVYKTTTGEILNTTPMRGKTGSNYEIDPSKNDFPGYKLIKHPALKGKVGPQDTAFTLVYAPIKTTLTVEYLDRSGNVIHKPLSTDGEYTTPYTIKVPKIDGYELTSDSSLLSGYYDKEDKTVVLRFNNATVKFQINYWFDKAKTQRAGNPRVVSGTIGEPYNIPTPELETYDASTSVVSGTFDAFKNPDIDVFYSKIQCQVKVLLEDEAGRPLLNAKPIIGKNALGEKYKFKLPQIEGYIKPQEFFEGTYSRRRETQRVNYKAKQVSVEIKYIDDKTGKEIVDFPAKTEYGLVGTAYNYSARMIDGYTPKSIPSNAKGIFTAKPKPIVFRYQPNASEIVIHSYDNALNLLGKPEIIKGYYGKQYNIKAHPKEGYTFERATADLTGTFPATRQDINVFYKAQEVNFNLIPVNQYDEPIDQGRYIKNVSGLVNQPWSRRMPVIPGYDLPLTKPKQGAKAKPVKIIGGMLKASLDGKDLKLHYRPKKETALIHFVIKGGENDGLHPWEDDVLTGLMDQPFKTNPPKYFGYTAEPQQIVSRFTAEQKEITVEYKVNHEEYQINFVYNNKVIKALPKGNGYFHESINIAEDSMIPQGYHLPTGADQSIYLDGSGVYNVPIIPQEIMVTLIAQTEDGVSLGTQQSIYGKFGESRKIEVPAVKGYLPVNGPTVTLNFDLGVTTLPITYKAKTTKIVVKYFSTDGTQLMPSKTYSGQYQKHYEIKAPHIDKYVVQGDGLREGTFGLDDSETIFSYRAGADELNSAIVSLDDISNNSNAPADEDIEQEENVSNNDQVQDNSDSSSFDNLIVSDNNSIEKDQSNSNDDSDVDASPSDPFSNLIKPDQE
ncbi:MucBP domain-containing protein [Lactobacillus crispatus]|jgi:hypothetical protein|uniref:MucBP domain-containing protein n=1 Tax=Lactobacillus crispatus TaxID=47770 RepID=A0ABV2B695_9LACO|nr:MucBP domain-containing protein [Lactobacillus crispatus]KXI18816.1 MucBP domain protein [Lactobacillus crispatus]NJJ54477.1 hypothetical protein [Lactobacillus crispatus]UAY40643.1 MucBP domain-containing protein [Lactobacillus crispatus]